MHLAVRMRPLSAALRVAPIVVPLVSGCDEPSAIDLELVADPKVNTVAQVLGRADAIELVLDSPLGLYDPSRAMDDGRLRIEDVDGDPPLELVVRVPVPDARFPRIRLERGGLPDVPLTIRIYGFAEDEARLVASGAVDGIDFGAAVGELAVPFDLVPEELPPRVVDLVATPSSSCTPPTLTVLFSRGVDPATVLAAGAITFEPGGAPRAARIDIGGRLLVLTAPDAVVVGDRIGLVLSLATTIATVDGLGLDQTPGVDGAQAYVGRYESRCTP